MITRISTAIALIAIMLATFALVGCMEEEALTAEQIVAKAVAAMDDVESYRAEMDMGVTMKGEAGGESVNWTMSMDGSSSIDQGNSLAKASREIIALAKASLVMTDRSLFTIPTLTF